MRSDKHDTIELMVDKQRGCHGEYYARIIKFSGQLWLKYRLIDKEQDRADTKNSCSLNWKTTQ